MRAKLLREDQALREYQWSSFSDYLCAPAKRTAWLRVERLFGEMRIPRDSAAGRRAFEAMMEERRAGEERQEFNAIRGGWCLGAEKFREELLAQMSERVGAQHYGAERQESGEVKAERLVAEELEKRAWDEEQLGRKAKGDPAKVQIARRLRQETVMTLKWIADRLKMGSWTHVSNLLARSSPQRSRRRLQAKAAESVKNED